MPHEAGGREVILDFAAKLFNQKGYTGVSIRDIAQACGMTNAALYYHFKNKEDLYLAVVRCDHEKVMASIAEAVAPTGDLRQRLKQLVVRYADVMCGQRQSFQTLRHDLAHMDKARAGKLFGEIRADFMRPIQQVIETAQAAGQLVAGDSRLYARLLHGMIIAMTFEGKALGRPVRVTAEDVDVAVDVFLKGVAREA
ncbi:MAG TPA: TetR/AcrR family transcriptional regulator [Anaerolineae bacterium]|nr:TetR/AcrR family transcriptional regulator [Anaerolineae bacterium]